MTFEEQIKLANDYLTAAIKLGDARLFDDNYTNEDLEQQAAKYGPTMSSLHRRLRVKSYELIYDRASQLRQIYEREYEYCKTVLSYNLEPYMRGLYLIMQQRSTEKIHYMLSVMILRHLPKHRL